MSFPPQIAIRPISRPIDQTVRLPGSKSLTNRALLAAALARGESVINGALLADDTRLMIEALGLVGIAVIVDEPQSKVSVTGAGGFWPSGEADLYCGNAGTVTRFLTAVCAAVPGEYRVDGSARMRQRPIGQLVDALRDLGAAIGYEQADGHCPLTIHGKRLRGGIVEFRRTVSSQFISAILLAAPLAASDVCIRIADELSSAPYVDMTVQIMRDFGVELIADKRQSFIVPAPQTYRATKYAVEPDASAASYFFAAAALTGGRVTVEGLGSAGVQGDMAFVHLLRRMGCRVEQADKTTTVIGPEGGRLRGIDADLRDMPDMAQTLAVVAAFADGPTVMRNVGSLRVKETDRLFAISTELGRLGIETHVTDDTLTVQPGKPPTAGVVHTYQDHRMAMSFALAGLLVDGIVIDDPGCVSKTFPTFFDLWSELGG